MSYAAASDSDVKSFIKQFHCFGNDVVRCFTERNCYYFHVILKSRFHGARCFYDRDSKHILSKIGEGLYDIDGRHSIDSYDNLVEVDDGSYIVSQLM